jgi:hypothetical protein
MNTFITIACAGCIGFSTLACADSPACSRENTNTCHQEHPKNQWPQIIAANEEVIAPDINMLVPKGVTRQYFNAYVPRNLGEQL